MRKFLIGLLSVFVLFGASLLSACGKSKIDFTLSEQSVSIELYGGEESQSTATINATISGGDDVRITASVSGGYENSIVNVSTKYVSSTRTDIVLTGLSEGEAEVKVQTNQGNVVKYISVSVFSSVSSMEQREELGDKKNYLVRGITNALNENDLISFFPNNKSRRNITWRLAENKDGLTLDGTNLTISDDFKGDIDPSLNLETVKLIATTEKGITAEIVLPVLDKIDDNIDLQFSHSKNSGFKNVSEDNNVFEIVPNIPTDNQYRGYFLVNYIGDLEIKAHVYDANGEESDDLIVNRDSFVGDLPCFVIFANSKKTNINGNYKVSFSIGYPGYTYRVDSADYLPITVKARERVNKIEVSTNEIGNVAGSVQTLYTTYAESRETSVYGQKYYITISPSTVIDATEKYKISLKWLEAGGVIADGCPVEVWFQDVSEANRWRKVEFTATDDGYEASEDFYLNVKTIYIKAADSLTEQSVERLSMTFTSIDNTDISTTFNLRLVRSVSLGDFTFEDADIKIDSSENEGNVVVKKEFTIQGQTDVDGLYIINNSNAVIFDPIRRVNNTRDSVTFELTVSLKPSSYGITRTDTYQIAHRNGLVTNPYNIDIFQPLKWASIHLNSAENQSNSVVDYDVSRKTYSTQGALLASDDNDSISKLMLHNATTTPLLYYFNSVNGINAQAEISVGFFDFNEEDGLYTLEQFKELMNTDAGCITIINQAKNYANYSKIASFSGDYTSLVTKSSGFTYAVISFTGKGIENVDENGNYSFVKIIQIESFVAPMGLEVRPSSDKNISLYSLDSLATSDEALTKQNVTVRFNKTDITYRENSNVEFVAMSSLMGRRLPSADGTVVTWQNGRYSLSNIAITGDGISFTILANSTFGENIFRDTLEVHYSVRDVNGREVYGIFTTIDIVIRNAQRIESLAWENYDKDGLYFEVGDTSPKYMILSTAPANAKNNTIAYVVTDEKGNVNSTFLSISDAISSSTLSVNLSGTISEGVTGYVYVLPADAIYNGKIKYYVETEQNGRLNETSGEVDVNYLGQKMSQDMTYYDYLVSSGAYFISNATGSIEKRVAFSEILIRVKLIVADGRSFDYAYRIYDSKSFAGMRDEFENTVSKFYTVMNSIDLTSVDFTSFENITGGIQGYNSQITVKMNGQNLAFTNDGEIRNITFIGSVNAANGFVVDVNNGHITNVTIDVNGRSSSKLDSSISQDAFIGGIASVNTGTIDNASVLGLTILASNTDHVGGIAGRNEGKILNSRVEFYNLEEGSEEEGFTYSSNSFSGGIVGAIVGQIGINSTIDHTYAYDYTLSGENSTNHVILGTTTSGAFAGDYQGEETDEPTAKIDYSFAVVGVDEAYGRRGDTYDNSDPKKTVLLTNYYVGYYNKTSYFMIDDHEDDMGEPNDNFVSSGEEGFYDYVNKGKYHLKGLYQDEKVDDINFSVAKYEENGYYKSLPVDNKNGILFFYKLRDNFVDLNEAQLNELNRFNTISLEQFIGESVSNNIIVTTSKINTLKVIGSTLQVLNTGDVDVTLSSKMDVQNNKTIHVKIIYALSDMLLSWTDRGGNTAYISDDSIVSIQETKSRDYFVSYFRPQVYLGVSANGYTLKENDISLKIDRTSNLTLDENKLVACEIAGGNSFKVNVKTEDVLTNFVISPKIFNEEKYQNSIDKEFERKFAINPTKGVITFSLTGNSLPITPSTNASIQVEIRTTAEEDRVLPVLSLRDEKLESISEKDGNLYHYHLPGSTQNMIDVLVTRLSEEKDAASGMFTYVYDVNFAVSPLYRSSVSEDLNFEGYILSTSGNSSLDEDDTFILTLTKQKFTNIDLINKMIAGSTYQTARDKTDNLVYEGGELSTILAPGNNSVLEVSVNPEFAFYDHVSLSYSGTSVSNAVSMSVLLLTDREGNIINAGDEIQKDYYIERARKINGDIDTSRSNMIVFTPTAQEKLLGKLYFKIWINTNVNRDTVIKFTATFYDSNNTQLSFANYYLTVSYLSEAKITVDGSTTAYLAKGSSADIKIDVLLDQVVDSLVLAGDNLRGISMSGLSEPSIDEVKGIKTYTAKIFASILAKCENDTLSVQATVSRRLGNSQQNETKTTVAIVVLVDFKVDADNITIDGRSDGILNIWQGIPKTINVGYNLIPESYVNPGDSESEQAIADITRKRNEFLKNGYYPLNVNNTEETYNYYINYKYKGGVLDTTPLKLIDRLFYVQGNQRIPIKEEIANKPFKVIEGKDSANGDIISFKGLRANMSVECVLETYVSAGGYTTVYETFFTVYVETYSDPDVPLLISNATEFKNLAPVDGQEIKTNDYILINDIVLEDYVPFDTSLISSLDGNGHTIFIRSYHLDPEATVLNLALFTHVLEGTLLKNVRVNVFDGGELTIDVRKLTDFNFAGFAIENEGVITNCEVVSFYTTDSAYGDSNRNNPIGACTKDKDRSGINIKFVSGSNEFKLTATGITSNIAGFVGTNSGSITNSRVGGETITILGAERTANGEQTGSTYASYLNLETFYMVGQGNMAGFVNTNSNGNISACYVKNIDMANNSNATNFYTSGFVGSNSSTISVSYIEGLPTPENVVQRSDYAYEGSSIKSDMGYVVGFVYSNSSTGRINDSYSNILIANDIAGNRVYLASGFVYENEGVIENGYSASQILNSKYTQMNFSGVDEKGDLRAVGTYINCYFFNKRFEDAEDFSTDDSQESLYKTGVSLITVPSDGTLFYGFAVADGENDGVWRINESGVTLIDANVEILSNRYVLYVEEDYPGVTGNSENGKYTLPYSTLTYTDVIRNVNTSLGTAFNPIIIANAQDFVSATGQSLSSSIQAYYNETSIWGTYRLVDNVDLSTLLSSDSVMSLPSSTRAFSGTLYGNSFTISGISITSEAKNVAFGLFSSIEKRGKNANPIIKNLNLEIEQVVAGETSMVGGLAGYALDSVLVSIDISFVGTNGVNGLNFVGGLLGLASGNNIIKNINITNPTIVAEKYVNADNDIHYFITDANRGKDSLQRFRNEISNSLNYNTAPTSTFIKDTVNNYSYAGSVIGFVDNYATNNVMFDVYQSNIYSINSVRVSGVVNVEAQVVGGAFGLTSYQTNIRDVGVTVSKESKILATKYFAGGVVGQSFSSLDRIFATHESQIQEAIEDNMGNFYSGNTGVERGILDLFYLPSSEYRQIYVGGLIGYAGSGSLDISYSRLNVTSPSADYAGGIIGGLDVEGSGLYQTHSINNNSRDSASINYFINEVYATGDVRADSQASGVNAGGIIGRAIGRVAFLSVNALNYITTYNYLNNQYDVVPDSNSLTNLSNYLKVNSLVGELSIKDPNTGEINIDNDVTVDNYTNHLQLLTYVASSSGAGSVSDLPSVAYYEGYYKSPNVLYTLNVFARIDGSIKGDNKLFNGNGAVVNVINSPSDFADSSTGHTYTQSGFISSGAWNPDNWDHELADLVPTIKFKRSLNVLYLDQWNVKAVFEQMSNSNATVIVRGRLTDSSDSVYGDIKLYSEKNGTKTPIETKITNFRGKFIRGKEYYNTQDGTGAPIKIKALGNFIESVGAGFTTSDLIIDYEGVRNVDISTDTNTILETATGLFINGTVSGASISSLEINIDSPIYFYPQGGGADASASIGLIAGDLKSTSVRGVKISYIGGSIKGADKNLINIGDLEKQTFNFSNLNIGLIAGTASQESTISIMAIENVDIDFAGSFFNLTKGFKVLKLGGYVGEVKRKVDAQPFNMVLSEMKMPNIDTAAESRAITISGTTDAKYYLGGYVGVIGNSDAADSTSAAQLTTGIDSISTKDGGKIDINLDFDFKNNSATYGDVYVGGVVGYANVNSFAFNANNSALKVRAKFETGSTVKNLQAGGLCGHLTGGSMSASNFAEIHFEVYTVGNLTETPTGLNKDKFYTDYSTEDEKKKFEGYALSVKEAYTGGLIGYTDSAFSYSSDTITRVNKLTNKFKSENQYYYPSVRLNVTDKGTVYSGSLVGYTQATATTNSLKITGTIISDMEFMVIGGSDTTAYVGGMAGYIESGEVVAADGTVTTHSTSDFGELNNSGLIAFNGAVYSNIKNLVFGGVVGKVLVSGSTNTENDSLNVYNSSFGGVVKVYGENSKNAKITTGGVLGNASSSKKFKLQFNGIYNYGDVYVEYDSALKELKKYNFGGIIGDVASDSSANPANIVYNGIAEVYSLMTSFNTQYQITENTAHALFGGEGSTTTVHGKNESGFNRAFYNHAVVLLTDENGVDAPYGSSSGNNDLGYDSEWTIQTQRDSVQNKITTALNSRIDLPEGHKLHPYSLSANDNTYTLIKSDPYLFNGRAYYMIGSQYNAKIVDDKSGKDSVLKNVAVFGDRSDVVFTNANTELFGEGTKGLFDSMTGFSSISGMSINANITYDNVGTGEYGILVGNMSGQSIVYAINVRGTLDVGGTGAAQVSGLVGKITNGHIYDVSTDLDIRYRAGQGGKVFGLTQLATTDTYKRIEDSFTGGSIQTLISADVTAFANLHTETSIKNCYAYPKLDLNDYTNENNTVDGTITIFGASETTASAPAGSYFNWDGIDCKFEPSTTPNLKLGNFNKTLTNLQADPYFASDRWTYDFDFNYGYPTLRYKYLNVSSYASLTNSVTKSARLDDKTRLQITGNLIDESGDNYDKYIHENTYERLGNGIHPAENDYFMIPNVALLVRMNETHKSGPQNAQVNDGLSKNFILKYDIDLEKIEADKNSDHNVAISADREFTGIFDGQNKTIKNLGKCENVSGKESLFTSVVGNVNKKAQIMNLRLTDVSSTIDSALAKDRIENAEISNITLSGNFSITSKGSADMVIGGLTPIAKNAELYAITNMIQIDVLNTNEPADDGGAAVRHKVDYYPGTTTNANLQVNGAVAGGIVGKMQSSTMKYCSNYGPINVATKNNGDVLMAGGLVGIALLGEQGNTITYSYNSTSVLTNYAQTQDGTSVCSNTGMFFAGGLVGYIQATDNRGSATAEAATSVKYSYNSGMIKAGNKANSGQIQILDRTGRSQAYNCASYAGGITSYIEAGKTVRLSYCYDEGAVEAVGANPITGWYFEDNKYVLKQNSNRNVYAYGLAYLQNIIEDKKTVISKETIENTCQVINPSKNNTNRELYDFINNNGASLENGSIITDKLTWNTVKSKVVDLPSKNDEKHDLDSLSIKKDTDFSSIPEVYQHFRIDFTSCNWVVDIPPDIFNLYSTYDDSRDYVVGRSIEKPSAGSELSTFKYTQDNRDEKVSGLYNMQVSSLGLPTRIVIPILNKTFIYEYKSVSTSSKKGSAIKTYYSYDFYSNETKSIVGGSDQIDGYYTLLALKNNNTNLVYNTNIFDEWDSGNNNKLLNSSYTSINNLKVLTRSYETLDTSTGVQDHTLKISGKTYYTVDGDNYNAIFSAGTYIAGGDLTLNLPYVPNVKYYSIQATDSSGQSYSASITSVKQSNNGGIIVSFKVFSEEKINAEFNIKVTLDYVDTVEVSLTKLKYFYVDDYSIGVRLPILGDRLKGYTLKAPNGKIYQDIIKVSKTKYEYQPENEAYIYEPSDEAENDFIYLAFDGHDQGEGDEGEYIYVPNAELTIPGVAYKKMVNVHESFLEKNQSGSITGYIPLKPSEGTEEDKDNKFVENIKLLINEILAGLEDGSTQDTKLLYNRVRSGVSVKRSIASYMTQYYSKTSSESLPTGFSLKVGEESSFMSILGAINVVNDGDNVIYSTNEIRSNGKNIVAVDNNGQVILAVDSDNNIEVKGSVNTTYGGCTLTKVGNKIQITPDSSMTGDIATNVANYFKGLKYYANDPAETRKGVLSSVEEHLSDKSKYHEIAEVHQSGNTITYQKRIYLGDQATLTDNRGSAYTELVLKNLKVGSQTVDSNTAITAGVKAYTLGRISVYYGTATISWENYLNPGNGEYRAYFVAGSSMQIDGESKEKEERIDVVYKASINATFKSGGTTCSGSSGRTFAQANSGGGLNSFNIAGAKDSAISSLTLSLTAYPTYRVGSQSKEESYAYKFLLKDGNAYYQVELKDFDETKFPEDNNKDVALSLSDIKSVSRLYISGNKVTHYIKVNFSKIITKTHEVDTDKSSSGGKQEIKGSTVTTFSYSINLFDGKGEQDFYKYRMEQQEGGSNGFKEAELYYNSDGTRATGSLEVKENVTLINDNSYFKIHGGKINYVDEASSSSKYAEDENGFLVFKDASRNGRYIIGNESTNYRILYTEGKDYEGEIEIQDQVLDASGSQVGTLMVDKSGYYVRFGKEATKYYLQMDGYKIVSSLSSLRNERIYSPDTQKSFTLKSGSAALNDLDMNSFENIFKLAKQSFSMAGTVYYIYLDSNRFTMGKTISSVDNTVEFYCEANIPKFEYKEFDWNTYKPAEIVFSENVSLNKYITDESKKEIRLYRDNISTPKSPSSANFAQENGRYSVFLTESGYGSELYAEAKLNKNATEKVSLLAAEPLEAADIILTRDIYFSNLMNGGAVTASTFTKNSNINIIGNGHFISFFGAPLFTSIQVNQSKTTWIRDVNLLGETVGKAAAPSLIAPMSEVVSNNASGISLFALIDNPEGLTLNITRSNIYGTFANDISGSTPVIVSNAPNVRFKDFKSYVSVNTLYNANKNSRLIMFDVSNDMLVNVENYGVIDLEDGDLGTNGGVNKDGVKGEDGMSLTFYNNAETPTTPNGVNNGIIKVGFGGNGGAGGNISSKTTSLNKTQARADINTQCEPADAGAEGKINGGNNGIFVGVRASSKKGAIGRLDLNYNYDRLGEEQDKHVVTEQTRLVWFQIPFTNIKLTTPLNFTITENYGKISYIPVGGSLATETECDKEVGNPGIAIENKGKRINFKLDGMFDNIFNLQTNNADFIPPAKSEGQ